MSARGRVCLARHGETEWSRSGRHTGRTDLPLTERGREQARRVGRALEGRTFARVLASPLRRAWETAELAGFGDEAERCDHLLEWDYGEHEGRTTPEIRRGAPGWSIWTGPVPGGESLDDVAARADRAIAEIRAVEGDVLVFAHGHLLRVLAARWCELDPREARRFVLETGTLSELGWEREWPAIRFFNAPV